MVKPDEALIGSLVSSTFIFGIWHESDWLKERFGLGQYMVRWFVEVPNLVGLCIN